MVLAEFFPRLRRAIGLSFFANFVAASLRYHHEQETSNLCHKIEAMIDYAITENKPTFEVPIAAFPGGAQGVLIEASLISPAFSGIAFRHVCPMDPAAR